MPLQPSLPFDESAPAAEAAMRRARAVPPGHLDELGAGAGGLREPWAGFFQVLGEDGIGALGQQAAAMARQIRDNGVTYNVYADNGGARAWALDLLPFMVAEEDWLQIERGVIQRATLANAVVADIYGPQTLLAKGLLPAGLVFGHPGYLRPLKGYQPPDGNFLHIVAVDLAHTAEGGWTVMAHRTETPSGMGYALENRLIISSLFADAFRELRVRRLPAAFAQLVATLAQLPAGRLSGPAGVPGAPPPRAADASAAAAAAGKHIVLLTPGPYNETYFEHTFLARYLGITLVEGKDLTVRNDVVYLKTLAGLERVDVILRRLDDAYCDPVELRQDSTLGVPGLLQAMRAGNVLVSNVPGSGFLETPAIHGFLPAIARELLGEPLLLPGVPSWWCGEDSARAQALDQLGEAFLMPTYPRGMAQPWEGPRLGMERGLQRLADWRERIGQVPDLFTIQADLPLSHAPRWEGPQIGSRAAMLRVYAIADGRGGWQVMPGGFTRLAGEGQPAVSMQLGGSSVDTWVLSSQPPHGPALAASTTLGGAGPGPVAKPLAVSSRAAENLFWAGRYAERAENNVRLCRLVLGSIESSDERDDSVLDVIGELTQACGLLPPGAPQPRASLRVFERSLVAALAESAGWTSVGQNLASHVHAATEIRNRLSNDHWRTILAARNDFGDAMAAACTGASGSGDCGYYDRPRVLAALDHLGMQLAAISGAQGDRMMRDEAWRLLFIGRHIERVGTLSTFLEVFTRHGALMHRSGFDLLLHLFDSTLTFRALYPGRTDMPALIEQIVIEPTNPRGLYGLLARLRVKLGQITPPASPAGGGRAPLPQWLPAVETLPGWEALCERDGRGQYTNLVQLCDRLGGLMAQLSDEISARYFSHAGVAGVRVRP
ncbi:circularly permuted type 2 ATP-grasp protein [Cupriavidus sp. WS]|uniref:circularly permuted type 2 ATP-grasp protein n=1 Tax=Cupriavidus sp. WS TaxID=1312922 RepID=UPI0003AB2CDF|nr:circularly permuted type 2 ATP-grasp protein [Cupriavidus sp. WS]